MAADRAEEALRDEFDLLCLGAPSAARVAAARAEAEAMHARA